MKRQKLAILPKLYDGQGDIKKPWFIFYSYRNPKSNKMQRFRIYEGINQLESKSERYALADRVKQPAAITC